MNTFSQSLISKSLVAAGLMVAGAGSAVAEEIATAARAGVILGNYEGESTITRFTSGGSETAGTGSEFLYGGLAGARLFYGNWFGDLGLEFMSSEAQGEDFERTDLVATVGYSFGGPSVFGGYRYGQQGDGFFNDDLFKETGFFIGAGYGGIALGPVFMSASFAYNFSEFESDGSDSVDYPGYSLKLGFFHNSAPSHIIEVRYQVFELDEDSPVPNPTFTGLEPGNIEIEETYLTISYVYAFEI